MTELPPFRVSYNISAGEAFVLAASRPGAAKRYLVPKTFAASGASANAGIIMTIKTGDDGVPRIAELTIREIENGAPINGGTLRDLPIARLLREAVATVAGQVQSLPGGVVRADFGRARAEDLDDDLRRPRRGSPLTDDHLGRVAEVYRAALARGEPPTQTVANVMHAARSTAARWVHKAREQGLLGPSLPGRGGEGEQS